jgi:hypothetical protein
MDSTGFRARVCEAHFSPSSIIINSTRKLLKRNSVPQLLLPLSNVANKGIQAIVETADASVQCGYNFETDDQIVQMPFQLFDDKPPETKHLIEDQRCRKMPKIAKHTKSEVKSFYKLCDKFLTPNLATFVKQETKTITQEERKRYNLDFKISD